MGKKYAIGDEFMYAPNEGYSARVAIVGGTQDQRVITIDDVQIECKKDEPYNGRRIHHLWRDGDWDEKFVLVTPHLAAYMYERGLVYVPNETIEMPGLWTVFVHKGAEEKVGTLIRGFDRNVFLHNKEFTGEVCTLKPLSA